MLLQPLRWFLWFLGRVVFSFRYHGRVVGWEKVKQHPGPYLILPNHPAYADPPNVLLRLWPFFKMRPMLLDPERRDEIHTELCAKHDLSDGAARVVLSRLRARFRELLRAEVARIVTTPEEMDDEIAYLASHLR